MWALWPAPGISQACGACIRNSCRDTIGSCSPRASKTGTVALATSEAKGAPAMAKARILRKAPAALRVDRPPREPLLVRGDVHPEARDASIASQGLLASRIPAHR